MPIGTVISEDMLEAIQSLSKTELAMVQDFVLGPDSRDLLTAEYIKELASISPVVPGSCKSNLLPEIMQKFGRLLPEEDFETIRDRATAAVDNLCDLKEYIYQTFKCSATNTVYLLTYSGQSEDDLNMVYKEAFEDGVAQKVVLVEIKQCASIHSIQSQLEKSTFKQRRMILSAHKTRLIKGLGKNSKLTIGG